MVDQRKPPRLRSACDQCNAAKVKCTGERQGCKRCVLIQADCIYGESRAGKVQGIRTRRKKTLVDNPPPDASSRPGSARAQREDGTESQALGLLDELLSYPSERQAWDDDLLVFDAPMDMMNGAFDGDATSFRNRSEMGTCSNSNRCTFAPSMSEGGGHARLEQQSVPRLTTVPSPTAMADQPALLSPASMAGHTEKPASYCSTESRESDGKCVLACSQIIVTLENYLLSDLKVLDLILGTVRNVNVELNRLLQSQSASRSERCVLLFITIMHQVMELLETGLKSTLEGAECDPATAGPTSLVPSFGFSTFSASAEEQRSWRAHILRKECDALQDTLLSVMAVASPREAAVDPGSASLAGLERRLRSMQERVVRQSASHAV